MLWVSAAVVAQLPRRLDQPRKTGYSRIARGNAGGAGQRKLGEAAVLNTTPKCEISTLETAPAAQEEQAMTEQLRTQPVKQRGRPKRPPPVQRVRVLTLRVPEALLRRLDAYTAQVQAAQPYVRLSRADVLRMVLDQGLPTAS